MPMYYINDDMELREWKGDSMIKSFDTHEETMQYCKENIASKHDSFTIRDYWMDGDVEFKNGKISDAYCLWGHGDSEVRNRWGFVSNHYEPNCSNCGDGGCIHCEPHRFYNGHIGY